MKRQHKFTVKEDEAGKRLDIVLAKKYPEYSRGLVVKQIKEGNAIIGARSVKASYILKSGDKVNFKLQAVSEKVIAEKIDLDIVFEDDDIAVINKTAGMVMHPAGKHTSGTLANALKSAFGNFYLVHRLDKDTSGIVLVAKTIKAKEWLINLFAKRQVAKTYLVLVKGKVAPKVANLDLPIKREQGKFIVKDIGRLAQSRYEVQEYFPGFTLLKVFPKTGRTHQIRVHFNALGHPVAGDILYGGKTEGLKRQFLHAMYIEFTDWNGKLRNFSASVPKDLNNFLENVKK